jgi:predicted HTH transcriptional regulator
MYVCCRSTGEVIDYWERRSRGFPKEMKVDMTTEEICERIKKGENQKVEFKGKDVRNEKLAKELVAFANTNDGIIFMGVDDEGNINGVTDTKSLEERIINVADKISS